MCGKPAVGWTACWYVSTGADGTARSVLRQPSTTTYLARYVGSKSLDPSLSLPVTVAVRR